MNNFSKPVNAAHNLKTLDKASELLDRNSDKYKTLARMKRTLITQKQNAKNAKTL